MIAKILIVGQIGNTLDENGKIVKRGVELADVIMQFKANEGAERFDVLIESEGGDVLIGREIANYIRSFDNTYTIAGTFCASMGTEIHLSVPVERRSKVEGGRYIIHNPLLTGVNGNASQLIEAADYIQTFQDEMLSMYVKSTGMEKEAIKGLMALETDLTDEQCKAFKFVSLIQPKIELKAVAFHKEKPNKSITMAEVNTAIDKTVGTHFKNFMSKLGIKMDDKTGEVKVDKAAATANVGAAKVIKKVVRAAAPKAETLMTDADVAVYTDKPIADFVADPTIDVKVFSDEAMTVPMVDGTYNMKDGSTIDVSGGLLTEYAESEVEASTDEKDAEIAKLNQKIVELEGANAKIKEEMTAEFATAMTNLKNELGSNYVVKPAATTTSATRNTTTKVKPGAATGSMAEQAKERRGGYKGSKAAATK